MPALRAKTFATAALRSPGSAVLFAYFVRMLFLWLSHFHEDISHPRFETVGMEALLVARSIATGHGFSHPFPGYDLPTAWLAPVYPALAALGYKLFRMDDFCAVVFCQTINAAFSAATAWPIYSIGKRALGVRIGLASAWLWAILPVAILLPLEWTWDQSLSALLLASLLAATFRLGETSTALSWTGYGLLWAFGALVNPTLCTVLPFLLGWLVWRRRSLGLSSRLLLARAAVFFALALVPWTVRNWFAVDGFSFVKSNFGIELWLGNNADVRDVYTPEKHPASDLRERIVLTLAGEPNYTRQKQSEAVAFIRAHPRRFARLCFNRFLDTWAATYDSRVEPWIAALHVQTADVWLTSVLSVFALAGLLLALREAATRSLPLVLAVVALPLPYYITHSSLRYRHPIDPVLTVFVVLAASRLFSRLSRAFGRADRRPEKAGPPARDVGPAGVAGVRG